MAEVDYYRILGVAKEANASQIKARYQSLAKMFHPDHNGDDSVMSLINEAYQVLSDPQKRYNYDHANDQPKTSASSHQSYTRPNQTNYSHTTNQTYTNTTQPKVKARPKRKNNAAGSIVSLIILGILWLVFANHSSSNSTNSSNTTPAQAAIDSMHQYYAPANASSFTAADETSVTSYCMSESAIASYPYSNQVRYCGCALGSVEQNYTPKEVSQANTDGTLSTLESQNQSTISEYCNNLL